ncbi:MAG TPA: hypothetical protein VEF04_11885, partial [Blastocatellia bacterium]|nr:hypothetical protein [Blastocatellia bacterium]
MAKAIITIHDTGIKGRIGLALDCDPPLKQDERGTPAQHAAIELISLFNKMMRGEIDLKPEYLEPEPQLTADDVIRIVEENYRNNGSIRELIRKDRDKVIID